MAETPRPWHWESNALVGKPNERGFCPYVIHAENGTYWSEWTGSDPAEIEVSEEDAALIVKCVNLHDELVAALKSAIKIAEEARQEWDRAPNGMRAGKILIALAGHISGYRPDIDAIHSVLAKAEAE